MSVKSSGSSGAQGPYFDPKPFSDRVQAVFAQASQTVQTTPAGALDDPAMEVTNDDGSGGVGGAADPGGTDLSLRPLEDTADIRDIMIQLQLLSARVTQVLSSMNHQTIEGLQRSRDEQASQLKKALDDLARKLAAARDSWFKHLPGWAIQIAMTVALMAAAAGMGAGIAATGPAAAGVLPLLSTFATTLAAASAAVYTGGSIGTYVETGKDEFGAAAGKADPSALDKILDALGQMDIGALIAGITEAAGTEDSEKLMIVGFVCMALSTVLMAGAFSRLAKNAPEFVEKMVQVSRKMSNYMQGVQAVAAGAQAGVTHENAQTEIAKTRSQARLDKLRVLMDAVNDQMSDLIRFTSKNADLDTKTFEAVMAVMTETAEGTSHILA